MNAAIRLLAVGRGYKIFKEQQNDGTKVVLKPGVGTPH